MVVSGKIAQSLILAISQRGLLYLDCQYCEDSEHCNAAPLAALAHTSWLAGVERIVTSYGWGDEEEAQFDAGLLTAILEEVDKWRRPNSQERTIEQVESFIRTLSENVINSCISEEEDVPIHYILDAALYVTADATVTCTTFFEGGGRFIKPLDDKLVEFADRTVFSVSKV